MTHPILAAHPEVVALHAERDELERVNERNMAAAAAIRDPFDAAVAAHRQESDEAVAEGREPPAPPPEPYQNPSLVGWPVEYSGRRRELVERERDLYRALHDEVVEQAHERERELLDRARPAVSDLDPIVSELRALAEVMGMVGERNIDAPTAPTLVAAVMLDGRLLVAAPPKDAGKVQWADNTLPAAGRVLADPDPPDAGDVAQLRDARRDRVSSGRGKEI